MGSLSSDVLQSVLIDTGPNAAAQQGSLSLLGPGFELGLEPGSEQGSLSGLVLPSVKQATSDVSLNNYWADSDEAQQPSGEGIVSGSSCGVPYLANQSGVSLEIEGENSAGNSAAVAAGQDKSETYLAVTPPTGDPALSGAISGVSMEVQLLSSLSLRGGAGVLNQSAGGSGTSPSQVVLNLEEGREEVEQSGVLENKAGLGGGVVYEGVDVVGGAGSIMNAADPALALDLDQVPLVQDQASLEPFSPVLPTTQLEVGMEERAEESEEVDGVEIGVAMFLSHQTCAPGEEIS